MKLLHRVLDRRGAHTDDLLLGLGDLLLGFAHFAFQFADLTIQDSLRALQGEDFGSADQARGQQRTFVGELLAD
jgi:hypothetical protein